MRFLPTALTLAALSALSIAKITLDPVDVKHLAVGDSYTVEWSADNDYINAELHLVQKTSYGWLDAHEFFSGRDFGAGDDNQEVTIPNVVPEKSYAFWLSADNAKGSNASGSGYAALTPWFDIEGGTLVAFRHGLTRAELAGIIIGVILALTTVAGLTWFFLRRKGAPKSGSPMALAPDARRSMDSIEVEKERVRLASKGWDA